MHMIDIKHVPELLSVLHTRRGVIGHVTLAVHIP